MWLSIAIFREGYRFREEEVWNSQPRCSVRLPVILCARDFPVPDSLSFIKEYMQCYISWLLLSAVENSFKMLWSFSCLFYSVLRLMLYSLFSALKFATRTPIIRKFDWRFLSVLRPVGDPKEREKVNCNDRGVKRLQDTVVETARKTGNDTEVCLKLFGYCCASRTPKNLQIG